MMKATMQVQEDSKITKPQKWGLLKVEFSETHMDLHVYLNDQNHYSTMKLLSLRSEIKSCW